MGKIQIIIMPLLSAKRPARTVTLKENVGMCTMKDVYVSRGMSRVGIIVSKKRTVVALKLTKEITSTIQYVWHFNQQLFLHLDQQLLLHFGTEIFLSERYYSATDDIEYCIILHRISY